VGKHRQQVKVLTEWDSIEDRHLEVGGLYAISPKTFEVWGMNRLQQVKDPKTGAFAQVISDISYKPITLFPDEDKKKKDTTVGKNIDSVALDAAYDELATLQDKHDNDKTTKYLGIIACIMTLVLGLMYLLR